MFYKYLCIVACLTVVCKPIYSMGKFGLAQGVTSSVAEPERKRPASVQDEPAPKRSHPEGQGYPIVRSAKYGIEDFQGINTK